MGKYLDVASVEAVADYNCVASPFQDRSTTHETVMVYDMGFYKAIPADRETMEHLEQNPGNYVSREMVRIPRELFKTALR